MSVWVGKNPCGWELPSSAAGFPNLGSPSSLLTGWRKLGRVSQLETSEFRSRGPPKLSPLCSWASVERSCEAAGAQKGEVASAEAPGGSAGGPQPPCRLPGCHARCSAPFRGGLSGNWGPEEFMVCIYMFFRAWTLFRHGGGRCQRLGSVTAQSIQRRKVRNWKFTWMPPWASQNRSTSTKHLDLNKPSSSDKNIPSENFWPGLVVNISRVSFVPDRG